MEYLTPRSQAGLDEQLKRDRLENRSQDMLELGTAPEKGSVLCIYPEVNARSFSAFRDIFSNRLNFKQTRFSRFEKHFLGLGQQNVVVTPADRP